MRPLARPVAMRSDRSVWIAAFAISGILHALVLGIRLDYPVVNRQALHAPRLIYIEPVAAMRVYDVVPLGVDMPTSLGQTVLTRPPQAPPATAGTNEIIRPLSTRDSIAAASLGGASLGGASLGGASLDAASSIFGSSLSRRADNAHGSILDRFHNSTASVSRRIGAYNDSIAAIEHSTRRATYWTETDANGQPWGVSPDAIHVGRVTVPLRMCTAGPCPGWLFSGPLGRRAEHERHQRVYQEIQHQRGRAEVRAVIEDRVKAIRARALTNDSTVRPSRY